MDSMSDLTKVLDSSRDNGLEGDTEITENSDLMVFLCGQCKIPLGDTYGWKGSDMEEQTIMLKVVSTCVIVEKDRVLSKHPNEYGCIFEHLVCSICKAVLGKIYRCTPKHLDFKRDLFCLNVEAVDTYILGSSCQQVIPEPDEPVTFENRMALEDEITKAQVVLDALEAKLASFKVSSGHTKG
ncbi:protein Mis18-alpha [Pelodytes ibericus]